MRTAEPVHMRCPWHPFPGTPAVAAYGCPCCPPSNTLTTSLTPPSRPPSPRPPPPTHTHPGKNLQAQYERWQSRAKYKMHLDPTLDDVKKLCASCRRTAKVGGCGVGEGVGGGGRGDRGGGGVGEWKGRT
jgi:hypothetical protein